MAKILFFANDPAGANSLNPLIEPLKSSGHEVVIYATGSAVNVFKYSTEYNDDINKLLDKECPDFVLTGASAMGIKEKEIRKFAKDKGIPSLSILDNWSNCALRYSSFTTREIDEYNKNKNLIYVPNYIVVPDEFAKEEMVKEGIDENIIYPFGNPYFNELRKEASNVDNKLRESLINGKKYLITWASEPFSEDYGKSIEIDALKDAVEIIPSEAQLVIKPHPKENPDKFKIFEGIPVVRNVNSREIIKASDLVLSMTSTVLIECELMNKKCLSYQKNETDRNKFVLTKIFALPFINDKIDLKGKVRDILHNKDYKSGLKIKTDAKERVIEFIEEKLCQN